MSANVISTQQTGLDVKAGGSGGSAPISAGELQGRDVKVVNIYDMAACNTFVDAEVAQADWSRKKVCLLVCAVIATGVAIAILGFCLHSYLAVAIGVALIYAPATPIFPYDSVQLQASLNRLKELQKGLESGEFVSFTKGMLGGRSFTCEQLLKARALFLEIDPNKMIDAQLQQKIENLRTELASQR
jgi:hypothetical protein